MGFSEACRCDRPKRHNKQVGKAHQYKNQHYLPYRNALTMQRWWTYQMWVTFYPEIDRPVYMPAHVADKIESLTYVEDDQIQIQIHKYKYKYAHTNTNTNTGGAPKSNFDFLPKNKSFHENGHISGTVRPTSLQYHSNRSSWRARPEKHPRGSLTCPGNTGEPEAPVLGGAQTHRNRLTLGPEPEN